MDHRSWWRRTCARLVSSTCAPGQIVVTSATRDRIGPSIALRPMGAVTLRGRDVPVEIFEHDAGPVARESLGGSNDAAAVE